MVYGVRRASYGEWCAAHVVYYALCGVCCVLCDVLGVMRCVLCTVLYVLCDVVCTVCCMMLGVCCVLCVV